MTNVDGDLVSAAAALSKPVRIDLLSPTLQLSTDSHIEAVIVLVWPFSSSSQKLSLLLADPDVRLRKSKGQVRVTFEGECAREVARSHLGIGDSAILGLDGAEWVHTGDVVSTPGKKVEWDLIFRRKTKIEVKRAGEQLALVDFEGENIPAHTANGFTSNGFHYNGTATFRPNIDLSSITFSSPAVAKPRRHTSSSFVDASLDPFAEDDGFILGKGRKRTKFARHSGSWKLDDSSGVQNGEHVSPTNSNLEYGDLHDGIEIATTNVSDGPTTPTPLPQMSKDENASINLETTGIESVEMRTQRLEEKVQEEPPGSAASATSDAGQNVGSLEETDQGLGLAHANVMPPPRTPSKRLHIALARELQDYETLPQASGSEPTLTPRLHPLPSPGLPLVSPLIQRPGALTGYFLDQQTPVSDLDGSGSGSQIHQNIGAWPDTVSDTRSSDLLVSPVTDEFSLHGQELQYPTSRMTALNGNLGSIRHADGDEASQSQFPLEALHTLETERLSDTHRDEIASSQFQTAPMAEDDRPTTNDLARSEAESIQPKYPLDHTPLQGLTEGFEDEDMYGPSSVGDVIEQALLFSPLVDRDKEAANGYPLPSQEQPSRLENAPRLSGHAPTSWESRLTVSAVECVGEENPNETSLAFNQKWDTQSRNMKSSTKGSPLLDATVNENQEEPSPRQEDSETSSSVIVEELEVDLLSQPTDTEPERTVLPDHISEATDHRSVGERRSILSEDEIQIIDLAERRSTILEWAAIEVEEVEDQPPSDVEYSQPTLEDRSTIRHQPLPTPENTQNDPQPQISDKPGLQREHVLPPSPQNTQKTSFESDIVVTSIQQSESSHQHLPTKTFLPSSPPMAQRSSQRLSRKSINMNEITTISNPYFTLRRLRSSPQSAPLVAPVSPVEEKVIVTTQAASEGFAEKAVSTEVHPVETNDSLDTVETSPATIARRLGLSTPLSYYVYLSVLSDHFSKIIDILAICMADSKEARRARYGPRDFYCSLQLVDSSLDDNLTATAQIFRPYKSALPKVQRGDVILLRDFKVQSSQGKFMLLSTESSAWMVFSLPSGKVTRSTKFDIQASGPPLEYGHDETELARDLTRWWQSEGATRHPLSTADKKDEPSSSQIAYSGDDTSKLDSEIADKVTPLRRSARRQANLTDNICNGAEEDIPSHSSPPPPPSPQNTRRHVRRSSDVSIVSQSAMTRNAGRSRRSESVIHELRDGTTYIDENADRISRAGSVVHELRGGTKYIDEDVQSVRSRRSRRSTSLVHELRDGAKYTDEI